MDTKRFDETASGAAPLHCPTCGTDLFAELLVIEDEAGQEAVLVLDCPTGDLHLAITEADVRNVMAKEVMARLRPKGPTP